MKLIKGNHEVNLSKQPFVTEVWCSVNKNIVIHLSCKEGDERKVIDDLPKWIFDEMRVVESHTHVYIKEKK